MAEKKSNSMTPEKLRLVLIGSMFLMIIGSGGLFWLFREQVLIPNANKVAEVSSTAQSRDSEVSQLKRVQEILERDKDTVDRAAKIVADTKFYQYQDQIIKDLTAYAKTTGVTILKYDFNNGAAPSGVAAQPAGAATDPSGVKSVSVAVTLTNPLPYNNLMRFVHAIEANLTKMQLAGIAISTDPSGGVIANTLILKVFTK